MHFECSGTLFALAQGNLGLRQLGLALGESLEHCFLWASKGSEIPDWRTNCSNPDYARDPDSSGLGIRKNAVAL